MATEYGNYDDECFGVKHATGAEIVVLVVLRGRNGSGFAIQAPPTMRPDAVPTLLRLLADDIDGGKSLRGIPC